MQESTAILRMFSLLKNPPRRRLAVWPLVLRHQGQPVAGPADGQLGRSGAG